MTCIASEQPSRVAGILVKAGLRVLLPSDTEFAVRQASYWSNSAKVTPSCIVQPKSAEEVALVIKSLVTLDQRFAIRSGGHTQYAGANNITGGVTIDLGLMNWTRYDEATETADLAPGGRWSEVYSVLQTHGRVVAGGRDGNVGVGGILLGGGKTFFTTKRGFACDEVVEYEVVLADGQIVVADKIQNPDLFRALKGGSNNFGIVTNFKMNTLKNETIWAGLNVFPRQATPDAITALINFTTNACKDEDSHLLFFFTYTVIVAAYVQLAGIEKAEAYEDFLNIPAIVDTTKMTDVATVVSEYDIAPPDFYNTFFTATFKNDPTIVTKASELHDQLVAELKIAIPDGNFITQCLLQPLPVVYGQKSAAAGGNIMGIEDQSEDGLLFVAVVMVKTPEQEAFVYPKVKAWLDSLKEYAETVENGNLPWIYLNYADKSQDVLASYGAKNVKNMKEVAAKFDPTGVFQRLCPGGFKISDVSNNTIPA